jgi:hypothetical protein
MACGRIEAPVIGDGHKRIQLTRIEVHESSEA